MVEHAIRLDFEPWTPIKEHDRQVAASKALNEEIAPALAALEKHPRSPAFLSYYALTPRNAAAIAALLEDLLSRRRARLGTVHVMEWVTPEAEQDAEWFVLAPRTLFDLDGRQDGITRAKGDRIKGREAVRHYSQNVFVSDRALDVMTRTGLTGFDTFWVADTGKYKAGQWHHLVPTTFAGRGVDHPWFDPATRGSFKLEGFEEVQPTEDPWRRGANLFEPRQLLPDPPGAGPELRSVLRVLRDTPIMTYQYAFNFVNAPMRLLRRSLPTTDIAYAWRARPPENDLERDAARFARVCVSRRARDLMLENRLAAAADFEALIILDEPPPGAAVFDDPATPAPPIYPPASVAKMRAAEAKLRAKFDAKPKPDAPVKPLPLKPLLTKLKREIKKRGGDVAGGATPADVAAAGSALGTVIPARWAEVLQAVDGFALDNCAIFDGEGELRATPCASLPAEHRSDFDLIRLGWPDLPVAYLGVGGNDLGDPIFLDTTRVTPDGDCPVVHVDHETSEAVQTWPSISLFLKDALEPPAAE